MTPLDLVKCRLQVDKEKYKSLGNGFKLTVAEQGVRGLFLGWAPTAIGYSMQGLCKFGFYEFFKNTYSNMIGEENTYLYKTSLYLAASASAEFFADIALSPMEAVKVILHMGGNKWNEFGISGKTQMVEFLIDKFHQFMTCCFRSRCRPQSWALSQPLSGVLHPPFTVLRVSMVITISCTICCLNNCNVIQVSTSPLFPCGVVRFPTL